MGEGGVAEMSNAAQHGWPGTELSAAPRAANAQVVEPRLLTFEQAAEYLAVGRTTIYKLVGRGEIPEVKIGRCSRVLPEDLEAYIKAHRTRKGNR